jgi:hypothetical protein
MRWMVFFSRSIRILLFGKIYTSTLIEQFSLARELLIYPNGTFILILRTISMQTGARNIPQRRLVIQHLCPSGKDS